MKFDELLYSHLGEFGRYQKMQFFLVCIPTLFTAMHALSWTFTAADLPHRCRMHDEPLDNVLYNNNISALRAPVDCDKNSTHCIPSGCLRYQEPFAENKVEKCVDGYVYDNTNISNSAISRWEIVCERAIIKPIVQSAYYVGQFFGSLIFGFLGDRPVVSMVYYGVSMNPTFLGGNVDMYVTFIFGAAMEIPALFIVYLLIDRIGRKPLLAGGFLLASICLLSNVVLPKDIMLISMAQYLITKGAITGVYATIYTFTPELFPTVIRNSAMGVCSMVARVGAVAASYFAMWLGKINPLLVVLPFGSLALAAGVVALLLPETNGRPLPETIEEVEGRVVAVDERELQDLTARD
uniref:Major facilitator superfamily (MFS) profile domain-containing protein n=1 Tax=Plectus sambesii TaxID=2011161 RepID=A0A914X8G0_9BILA